MTTFIIASRASPNKFRIGVNHSSCREVGGSSETRTRKDERNPRLLHWVNCHDPLKSKSKSLQDRQIYSRPCNGFGSREVHRKRIPSHADNKLSSVFPEL